MKKISLLFLIIAAVCGCKAAGKDGSANIDVPTERNYTGSELTIGRRICAALKHKREFFDTLTNMQEQFRFKGETKACGSVATSTGEFAVAISTVSSTVFEYIPTTNRTSYFRDVVTEVSDNLQAVCTALSSSDNVSNSSTTGSSNMMINFLISDGYDRYEVAKRSKDTSGNYTLVSTEGVSVITHTTQADEKFFGVEKDRVKNRACPNSTDYSSVKQTWLAALTSF